MKVLLYLGIALSILCVSYETAAQSHIALATRKAELQALSERLKKRDEHDRRQVQETARRLGIPIRRELPNGKVLELQRFIPGIGPVFYLTYNVDAADTVSTDEVWLGGSAGLSLDGNGLTVGEWDAGAILANHPDLFERVTQVDGATALSNHSTHVAGTLIGDGSGTRPDARGMAPAAYLNAYDWNFDTAEMASAAANGMLVSNHSYGIAAGWLYIGGAPPDTWWWIGGSGASDVEDANFGYYDTQSQLWDQIAFDAPYYLIVKAAGNDRWDTGPEPGEQYTVVDQNGDYLFVSTLHREPDCGTAGYDCLPTASVAKNILTVGSVDDVIGGYLPLAGPASVQISGFSSSGPTDDGRIKPDLVGNGWLLMSTYAEDPYYAVALGTSMAAPNVTGSLLLLQQHYQDIHGSGNFMRAATLKALAIHTADESGAADGPDYQYGWGLLNTKAAAQVITDDGGAHQIIEDTLANGATNILQINVSDPEAVVSVTLTWMDPPKTPVAPTLDPPDSMLVNDLDLRITNGTDTYLPWVLNPASPSDAATTGDNFRDNVEQVAVSGGGSGSYSIEVGHKGQLLNGVSQRYSLIISIAPPAPTSSGLLIDENFSGGLPAGWSVNTARGVDWTIKTPVNGDTRLDNLTGGDGNFAMVDNNYTNRTITSLRTPTFDLSSTEAAVLSFKSYFKFDTFESINVDISTDGGTGWTNVWWLQGAVSSTTYVLDLTGAIAGHSSATLRFRFDSEGATQGNLWQIDDVQLEAFGGTPPPPPPGGDLPGQADNPTPTNSSSGLGPNISLSWTPGQLATSHNVYFGTDSTPDSGELQGSQTGTSFDPSTLAYATRYYWRIDETNSDGTTEGVTWSFTTGAEPVGNPPGQATNPNPATGDSGVVLGTLLSWSAGSQAASHNVYFGTDSTPDSGELQDNQTGNSFNPGTLSYITTYYWRIDEVNSDGTTTGQVWSFTTEPDPGPQSMHVTDLDASSTDQPRDRWEAQVVVVVHDSGGQPLSDATVSGVWGSGAKGGADCLTNAQGSCFVTKGNLRSGVSSISFTVSGISHGSGLPYEPADNTDSEGDSDGNSVVISRDAPPPPSNDPPTTTLSNPTDGSNFPSGASVQLNATATDTEDGNISADVIWSSGGASLGTGATIFHIFSDGTHTVTATVTDSGGATASDSITITVGNTSSSVVHVASLLNQSISSSRRWTARARVEVRNGADAVANATVIGAWSNGAKGSTNCTTGSDGTCLLSKSNLKLNVLSVTLTINDISGTGIIYTPASPDSTTLNQLP